MAAQREARRSEFPPERETLASLVDDFARHGRQTAYVFSRGLRQQQTTYGELATLARCFAAELVQRDIVKGDRVLLWGENSSEWVAAFFGCVLRGVLPVPLDVASAPDFARRVEREVSPKLLVADRDKLAVLASAIPQLALEDLKTAITTETASARADLAGSDALQIVFTSGTTAEPKGIVHTHHNVLASVAPIEREMHKYLKYERPFHPIRFLHTLPLSHVFGQFMGLWVPPLMAAEVHFRSRLVADELVSYIQRERISVLAAVPRVLDLLQAHVHRLRPDLEGRLARAGSRKAWQRWWRFRDVHRLFGWKFWAFVCGGAALSPASEKFWSALGFVVVQGYGMTETTALVSLNHPFRPARGTIGQVLPGREVRLSDEGEVLVRGETISHTAWQDGRLQELPSDWLATGDLAEFDAQGNLRFRGRKKDVIVTSAGLNIYPEDLEAALTKQPGLKAAAVVEQMSEHGPEPLAAMIVQPGADPQAVVNAANRDLAEFQQIRRWFLWPEPDLPRTSTGKVLRREIARRVAAGVLNHSGARDNGDLNLDSLAKVQLQAQLEQQYGVSLDEAALQQVKTQADVRQLIEMGGAPGPKSETGLRLEHRYPKWPWSGAMRVARAFFLQTLALPLTRFLAKPAVTIKVRHWPPSPLFLVCNHITSYDAAFVLYALPAQMRSRVAIAMSGEMLLDYRRRRNQGHWFLNSLAPVAYFLITGLFNVFPLPQYSGFRRSFRHAGEAADRGYSVLVFPEGRRSDDGRPQPFKSGTGLLWKELGIPALPVYIEGLGELKVRGRGWFRSGTIHVRVGDTLYPDLTQTPEVLTERLESAVFGEQTRTT